MPLVAAASLPARSRSTALTLMIISSCLCGKMRIHSLVGRGLSPVLAASLDVPAQWGGEVVRLGMREMRHPD
ncbi:hypothetical protein BCV69DRAFT_279501 [Microstroma glucosiphilum]|uniref:Uncharacterized protein n=1 Tax=Pseudomicrostroma glucosiphilum TaxID=1684307 RepID=A0A316UED5_9BASI|nr:hypothetical protein BCV69DRAFT_279501 [Pseudomicrostroma glucosiphilum]PWN23570.1 hypothetical protein BCV69DRAFT_279501 [Pseudomicrostroma glucosiphilum]